LTTLDMVGEAGGSYHVTKAQLDGIVAKVKHPVEQRESIGAVLRLVKGWAVTGEPWRLVLTLVLKRP
jgi:hypothetical protein